MYMVFVFRDDGSPSKEEGHFRVHKKQQKWLLENVCKNSYYGFS